MTFSGKTVIVTGATSGIGRAAAEAFGREGASVVVVGRRDSILAEVERVVASTGARASSCRADVTDEDAPARIVQQAVDRFGTVDVLVNAAGIISTGTIESTDDAAWDRMMAVNLRAPF